MLDQPKKMRANWQSGTSGGGQNDRLYAKKQMDKEQQEKKRKARMVHFATKMPSKDDDDDSDDENELNQFESLSINGAETTKSRTVILIIEVQAESPLVKNVTV